MLWKLKEFFNFIQHHYSAKRNYRSPLVVNTINNILWRWRGNWRNYLLYSDIFNVLANKKKSVLKKCSYKFKLWPLEIVMLCREQPVQFTLQGEFDWIWFKLTVLFLAKLWMTDCFFQFATWIGKNKMGKLFLKGTKNAFLQDAKTNWRIGLTPWMELSVSPNLFWKHSGNIAFVI